MNKISLDYKKKPLFEEILYIVAKEKLLLLFLAQNYRKVITQNYMMKLRK